MVDKVHYRGQSDRILSSHALHGSESLCKLLRYPPIIRWATPVRPPKSIKLRPRSLGGQTISIPTWTPRSVCKRDGFAASWPNTMRRRVRKTNFWLIFREARTPWLSRAAGRGRAKPWRGPRILGRRSANSGQIACSRHFAVRSSFRRRRGHHGLPLEVARYGAGGFRRGSSPAAVLNSPSAPALSPFLSSAKPSW